MMDDLKMVNEDLTDLHMLPDPVLILKNGQILFVGREIQNILSYSSDELMYKPLTSFVSKPFIDIMDQLLDEDLRAFHQGQRSNPKLEFKALRKDGTELWMEYRWRYDTWLGDQVIVGLLSDISEQKRIERSLRKTNRIQHTLLLNIPGMVYRSGIDRDVSMEYLSLETERLTGYHLDELMGGEHPGYYDMIYPEDREDVRSRIMETISSKAPVELDYRIVMKTGEVRHVHEVARAVYDESGSFVAIEGVVVDTTEQRKAEENLIQTERLHAIGKLASGVAHDFNNILTSILGRVQLLQYFDVSDKIKSGLGVIETAARDGAEIVKRIQEFTRTRKSTQFTVVDMNSIIREVVEITRPRWEDEAARRGLDVRILTELNPIPNISGNESELREVLTNLIFNSADAMENDGAITIKTELKGSKVCITLTDTGKGMSTEIQKRIFDPFFTTKGQRGTGLGLSVSFGIVQRHNGIFQVESQEGVGTTFKMFFPISKGNGSAPEIDNSVGQVKPAKIMIVDDEETVLDILREILEIDGHEVFAMGDGQSALDQFQEISPDVVLTDLGMPGINGWEVASSLHKQQPKLPIILCTGWGDNVEREKMTESGVDCIVGKPFDIDRIRSAIYQVQNRE